MVSSLLRLPFRWLLTMQSIYLASIYLRKNCITHTSYYSLEQLWGTNVIQESYMQILDWKAFGEDPSLRRTLQNQNVIPQQMAPKVCPQYCRFIQFSKHQREKTANVLVQPRSTFTYCCLVKENGHLLRRNIYENAHCEHKTILDTQGRGGCRDTAGMTQVVKLTGKQK